MTTSQPRNLDTTPQLLWDDLTDTHFPGWVLRYWHSSGAWVDEVLAANNEEDSAEAMSEARRFLGSPFGEISVGDIRKNTGT